MSAEEIKLTEIWKRYFYPCASFSHVEIGKFTKNIDGMKYVAYRCSDDQKNLVMWVFKI